MKSEKSVSELQMIELLKECETIVDDSYLETKDARRIMDAGEKMLIKCGELRESRDRWRNKFESLNINKTNNTPPEVKPSNSVTKAKIQKPTPDNGTKLGETNSSSQNVQEASHE